MMKAWIVNPNGGRIALGRRGVLIGRSSSCAIVIDTPTVSRRHALIVFGPKGVEVLPLARHGVMIGAKRRKTATAWQSGAVLDVCGTRLVVEVSGRPALTEWQLCLGGVAHPIHAGGFSAGRGAHDDLRVPAWPPGACVFHPLAHHVLLETKRPIVTAAKRDGGFFKLAAGDRFSLAGIDARLRPAPEAAATAESCSAPSDVALEFTPNGAILRLRFEEDHVVFLPRLRADLIAALLRPTGGAHAGDWLDDQRLYARLWPRAPFDRTRLNVLVHRARQSLVSAGLDAPALIERAPGGGATRFSLAEGARVSIV